MLLKPSQEGSSGPILWKNLQQERNFTQFISDQNFSAASS